MRQCNWANYSSLVALLADLRDRIAAESKLKDVRLIDAHSFCWIYSTLLKRQAEGLVPGKPGRQDGGRVVSGWEASIIEMRLSVQSTVANSNGQIVLKTVKNKELRMEPEELERHLAALLVQQDYKCALTGIPMQPHGAQTDKNLKPSLDRVDSNGHYEKGNLQVVCQFINFWKGASDNEEFKQLPGWCATLMSDYGDGVPKAQGPENATLDRVRAEQSVRRPCRWPRRIWPRRRRSFRWPGIRSDTPSKCRANRPPWAMMMRRHFSTSLPALRLSPQCLHIPGRIFSGGLR